jgi:hypothetical protein
MKMKKLVAYLFVCCSLSAYSQATEPSQDAGLWTTLNLDKQFNEKLSVFLTEEFRMKENFSSVNLFYTDIGVEVRPVKFLKVSLAYRSIQKSLIDETYSFRHRLMLDITLKQKIGNFALAYRQRLQSEVRDIYSSDNGNLPEWYSRNKFSVKYDFGKAVSPYLAVELRYQINDPRLIESNGTWHRTRYILGMDYKINDKNTFGLYYLIQNEYNVKTPQTIYILGLEYSYSF